MNVYQRLQLALATEGISGLVRRTARKFTGSERALVTNAKDEYQQLLDSFSERTMSKGYGDMSQYYWYHTIDLGDGLVTPGDYDYRSSLPLFRFPEDMKGKTVLDVGSATGFFAFEFEKRGADVTSVELPSVADWDMPLGADREQTLKELMAYHRVHTVEEVQRFHLDGPFEFCRKALKSNVRRCHSTVYDLSPDKLGRGAFDIIFLGDILLHTFSPFKALSVLAPLCRDTLIIAQAISNVVDVPIMVYCGGDSRNDDNRTWFHPNRLCLEQMLTRLGFRTVKVVGRHTGIARRHWAVYDRSIIHARR